MKVRHTVFLVIDRDYDSEESANFGHVNLRELYQPAVVRDLSKPRPRRSRALLNGRASDTLDLLKHTRATGVRCRTSKPARDSPQHHESQSLRASLFPTIRSHRHVR